MVSNFAVGEPVGVLGLGLQAHEVDDVHDADLELGEVAAQQVHRRQRLERGHVAAAGHDHVGIRAVVVRREVPHPEAPGAVHHGLLDPEPVVLGLLAGHDDVHVVAAAQTVVGSRQQAVRVGRQVDADDRCLLVHHQVDEPGVLMGEAVVVLAPHVARQQVVERRHRPTPRDVAGRLKPLGMLVEHGVDDVDERLVAIEQAVASGEQIALEPTPGTGARRGPRAPVPPAPGGRRRARCAPSTPGR